MEVYLEELDGCNIIVLYGISQAGVQKYKQLVESGIEQRIAFCDTENKMEKSECIFQIN